LHVFCYKPNFGLATKAKVYKGANQQWSLRVTFHVPGSVKKCEGMNPHTPKWVPTLGVGVSMDFRNFKGQLQGSKLIWNIKSVSLSVCLFIYRGLETQISFNKIVPSNSRAQKLFRTSSSYFLLLLLRPFSRSNCQRSLLLTFTFTSVSAQQLPSSMGEVFLGFGRWVKRFGCAFFGLRV